MKNALLALAMLASLLPGRTLAQSEPLTVQALTDTLLKVMEKERIPGLMLALVVGDTVAFAGGLGYSDLDTKRPADAFTRFRVGSVTKLFTSLALLRLAEEGRLSLDDRLSTLAPELPVENPWEQTHPIKITHLLEHTAGFDDLHFQSLYNTGTAEPAALELVQLHAPSLRCRWKPGERFSYSNPGYVVAGYLIEKLTGLPYSEYISRYIMEPMAMAQSDFNSFPGESAVYASGYQREGRKLKRVPFRPILAGAAGTLNSCAADMTNALLFFLRAETGSSFLSARMLARMETPSTGLAAAQGLLTGYGLGNMLSGAALPIPFRGHDGGIDGFASSFGYNRERGAGYAISNNAGASNQRIIELIARFLAQGNPQPAPPVAPADLAGLKDFQGYYWLKSPRNQVMAFADLMFSTKKITVRPDSVYVSEWIGEPVSLLPVGGQMFRLKKETFATHLLARHPEGGQVLVRYSDYYEQVSLWRLALVWAAFFGGLAAILTGLLGGPVALVLAFLKSVKWTDFPLFLWPFLGGAAFVIAFIGLTSASADLQVLGSHNSFTDMVYYGSVGFAIFALAGLGHALLKVRTISGLNRLYVWPVVMFQAALLIFFWHFGWIGLKLWDF